MNYPEIAGSLIESLGLHHPPVAVTFSHGPGGGYERTNKAVPAGCRFWQEGAARTFITAPADHSSCSIGMYTHHLEQSAAKQTDLGDALAIFAELGYVTEADLPYIPVLKEQPQNIVYGPLAEAKLAPAVVLLFVNAAQALVASEAAQQIENRITPALGRPACAVVPLVANAGEAAVSFGCCGARAYLDIFESELSIFAIPGAKLAQYAERIRVLARANATLSQFHALRRSQIEHGASPTIKDSLAALNA